MVYKRKHLLFASLLVITCKHYTFTQELNARSQFSEGVVATNPKQLTPHCLKTRSKGVKLLEICFLFIQRNKFEPSTYPGVGQAFKVGIFVGLVQSCYFQLWLFLGLTHVSEKRPFLEQHHFVKKQYSWTLKEDSVISYCQYIYGNKPRR